MAKASKLAVLILVIIAGLLIYLDLSSNDTGEGFGLFLLLLLAGFITFIVIVISDIVKLIATKSIKSFIPTIVGVIIISSAIYTPYYINHPNNTPVLIHAGYSPGVGAATLTLRTDSSFDFFTGALFSSCTMHGAFALKDSFIFLDRSNGEQALVSNRLLINDSSKIIFQVDSNGKQIENSIPFYIHIDNRNK